MNVALSGCQVRIAHVEFSEAHAYVVFARDEAWRRRRDEMEQTVTMLVSEGKKTEIGCCCKLSTAVVRRGWPWAGRLSVP